MADSVKRLSEDGPFRGLPQGLWPARQSPATPFTSSRRIGKPLPRVHIGLVSTASAGKSPPICATGPGTTAPAQAEHAATFQFWDEQYGAEVVAMAGDVVEMRVARPPTDRDDALELAAQQYLYCEGHRGTRDGDLQRLAAVLLGGTVWHFWWD